MKGVQYLVDDKGKKKAVLIDLRYQRQLWNDFYELLVTKERENEPSESSNEVKRKELGE